MRHTLRCGDPAETLPLSTRRKTPWPIVGFYRFQLLACLFLVVLSFDLIDHEGVLGMQGEQTPQPMHKELAPLADAQQAQEHALTLTSSAFAANSPIPHKYAGDGEDVSPPLAWSGAPQNVKEFALICDDPDAPTPTPWVHWVVYGIPPTQRELPEGAQEHLTPGQNDFHKTGYGGPMPPLGHGAHHYHFRLYALDAPLQAGPGLTKKQLLAAMQGHILAEGELVGTYERK